MKTILLISVMLVAGFAYGQASIPTIDTTLSARVSGAGTAEPLADLSRPSLGHIRRAGREFTPEENQQLLIRSKRIERSGGAGGDDVGNGGDELRQEFLSLAQQVLTEAGSARLAKLLGSVLSIYRVIAIEDLSLQSGDERVPVRAAVSEGIIFLDTAAWDPLSGLLSPLHDPRYEMLKLMNLAAGSPATDEELVLAWNKLLPRAGKIWCPHSSTSTSEKRLKKEFNFSEGLNAEATQNFLMKLCQLQKLVDCRVAKIITRGNGTHDVTVTGYELSLASKSRSDLQKERCRAAHACETTYEWAPRGQISPADYANLSREVGRSCR